MLKLIRQMELTISEVSELREDGFIVKLISVLETSEKDLYDVFAKEEGK